MELKELEKSQGLVDIFYSYPNTTEIENPDQNGRKVISTQHLRDYFNGSFKKSNLKRTTSRYKPAQHPLTENHRKRPGSVGGGCMWCLVRGDGGKEGESKGAKDKNGMLFLNNKI